MPNANAIVEQLKELGLRHGEKAGVAIASMVFVMCVSMAAMQKTIDTTPDQVKKAASLSENNLNRREDRETILKRIQEKGIKDSNFAEVVTDQVKTALVADNFKPAREWVTSEPGAGLIRDTPTLIAISEIYAYPGRGGALVFDLDEVGNRIPDPDYGKNKDAPKTRRRRRRRNAAAGGMMAGMGGMMGGAPRKKARKSQADIDREKKEEYERKKRETLGKLVGADAAVEAKEDEEKPGAEHFKEHVKGLRWVALTGVLDHEQMRANYRKALKNPAVAHPNYKRLDMQRQTLLPDGSWTKWEFVAAKENYKVLDNLPEEDEELAPENVRPEGLCDHLPFLLAGLWEKVHIASLVPKEKKEVKKPDDMPGGGMLGGMGGGGMGMPDMSGYAGAMQGQRKSMAQEMMKRGGMGGMMAGMGGGTAGGMGGPAESAGNHWKSDEKKVMIRGLDFTVEPDTTYRYRVRVVVWNPNLNREDVSPGVDTKANELRGPWSAVSDMVTMPPDVMPYATASTPPTPKSDMTVRMQVIRFHPDDGVTVTRNFDAGPGELVGEPRTTEIPVSDGSGTKSKVIDFNSRQIVLDVYGKKWSKGYQPMPQGLQNFPPIATPVVALVLRCEDGAVVVHGEADDEANEVRRDIDANYHYELSQSSKEREHGLGAGSMGMMGNMMQRMMGGGMGGGMR